ncbi:hypothetical protein AB205_0092380 [Aquarana catesbeiana]|uniref:Uncharacterized protein n=1 Tax=Aquarana catesbeiana TaxID=8400 RepID=A0A2G9Q3Y0_AQUCT|nr:hypothetical protein AB205_0092380 [Aquarana catesbeiana]
MMLFKKIITSLMFWGEFKTPQNHFVFFVCYNLKNVLAMFRTAKFGGCTQCANMCYLPSREINGRVLGVQPFLNNKVAVRKELLPQNTSLDLP